MSDRSFAAAGRRQWNSITSTGIQLQRVYKLQLKTFLFTRPQRSATCSICATKKLTN